MIACDIIIAGVPSFCRPGQVYTVANNNVVPLSSVRLSLPPSFLPPSLPPVFAAPPGPPTHVRASTLSPSEIDLEWDGPLSPTPLLYLIHWGDNLTNLDKVGWGIR